MRNPRKPVKEHTKHKTVKSIVCLKIPSLSKQNYVRGEQKSYIIKTHLVSCSSLSVSWEVKGCFQMYITSW